MPSNLPGSNIPGPGILRRARNRPPTDLQKTPQRPPGFASQPAGAGQIGLIKALALTFIEDQAKHTSYEPLLHSMASNPIPHPPSTTSAEPQHNVSRR